MNTRGGMNGRRSSVPQKPESLDDSTQPVGEECQRSGGNHDVDQTRAIGSSGTTSRGPAPEANSGSKGKESLNVNDILPGGMKTRTVADLRAARESRANEALKMKDQQLRILQDQNNHLLGNLDRVEEEATRIQQERLTAEEENRTLRETVFESQGRARAAEAALKKVQAGTADRDKQLRIMTDQNAELLRLLEQEETQTAKLREVNEAAVKELDSLRSKYGSLLSTAKRHEEMAGRAAREGQLRVEEVRLLHVELEQVKQQNSELKMKAQVELESLQEQLRVRKEKQYQLLEKLQGQEEAKRQAEDQVFGMEEKLRALHAKSLELETQLQVEARSRRSAEEANRNLVTEGENARQSTRELKGKVERSEAERIRMEMESRDSGEQLREMAEKVFQLLERLKLAELAKNKAMEALRHKDQELVAMKQKNSRLIKESTKEGKTRVKAELDLRVCQDQILALKKHNAQLACRCREEAKAKLKEHDERVETQDKVRTLGGRLSFLLNKMQSDEEAKVILKEEAKKTEAQVKSLTARAEELQRKLEEAGESNRIITQAVRLKQDEVDQLTILNDAANRQLNARDPVASTADDNRPEGDAGGTDSEEGGGQRTGKGSGGDVRDIDSVRANGGRGVFYVESRPTQGLLMAKAKRPADRDWLEGREVNAFLRRAQKTPRFKELAVERICQAYALLLVEEEDRREKESELGGKAEQLALMYRKNAYLQDKVVEEEEAKRRTLLRYVQAVKAAASLGIDEDSHRSMIAAVGRPGRGIIQLPESGVTDEEVHALAALLRGNTTIAELNLRGNEVTDEGAAAVAAILAGRMGLRSIDLRGNRISKQGIRTIAEALERSERVRHVYVHAGGKVEALGTGVWAAPRAPANADGGSTKGGDPLRDQAPQQDSRDPASSSETVPLVTVETVCVVDLRENRPPEGAGGRGAVEAAALAVAMEDPSAPLPPSASSQMTAVSGAKRTPVFAMSVLPGELGTGTGDACAAAGGARGAAGAKGGGRAADKLKREAAARRRAERRARDREERRKKQMELGWAGRNGGLDARPSSKGTAGGRATGGARKGAGGERSGLPRVGMGVSPSLGPWSRNAGEGQERCRTDGSDRDDDVECVEDGARGAGSRSPSHRPNSASGTGNQRQGRSRRGDVVGDGRREGHPRASPLAETIARRNRAE